MKWLLLILLFQLDETGQPGPATPAQQLFDDQQSCMTAGENARRAIPKEVLSIATCIPQSAFNPARQAPEPAPSQPKGN